MNTPDMHEEAAMPTATRSLAKAWKRFTGSYSLLLRMPPLMTNVPVGP